MLRAHSNPSGAEGKGQKKELDMLGAGHTGIVVGVNRQVGRQRGHIC